VDAFRLDAIPYLFEREGTTCENLPETHDYLKTIRAHMDAKYPGRMLLAEANQWPEDSLPYFGDGDECHMAFHFPVMPRMYMALAMEDRFPIIDIMGQTPPIPENCQWAMFLRNHDELTLEMVTDEDRDYMWRTYAKDAKARINMGIRRRLAPLLENHRGRIHLMNGLLFSFPGTPIVYYGDEIGMGDNIYLGDRNGVRTPMQWSGDRNAGFSRSNPQQLFLPVIIDPQYHYEQVNVEAQQSNQYSLLWWMKRLIAMRKRYKAFGRGSMEFLHSDNRKVLAYVRRYEDETILVVANLSRLVQCFDLDLSEYKGMVPVELSGGTKFPVIGDRPYFLNLGPFAFYWFALQREVAAEMTTQDAPLIAGRTWEELLSARNRDAVERAVSAYLPTRRWFGGKARTITSVQVRDAVELPNDARFVMLDVEFSDGEPQTYLLPMAVANVRREQDQGRNVPVIARLRDGAILYEPVQEEFFANALLDAIARKKQLRGLHGTISGAATRAFKELRGGGRLDSHVLGVEQSNTALQYGQELFLKLFRRLETGINTDFEITRFLNEETSFRNVPRVAGALEYRNETTGALMTVGILQGFTPNSGDAWAYTLDAIGRYFDGLLSDPATAERLGKAVPPESVHELARRVIPEAARDAIGPYLADAELLGVRTAQMHLALASRDDDPAFKPEPFTPHYQRSIYQFMRTQIVQMLAVVRKRADEHPEFATLLANENALHEKVRGVLDGKIESARIRIHGDYHLGQVLYTGNDFVIIDFEGEPARPLSERRIKRSALRDVAGMLRSFHYAPYAVLFGAAPGSYVRKEDLARLESGAKYWQHWVSAAFLRAYLAESTKGTHLPKDQKSVETLLTAYLIEKAVYEIVYELNNRPDWVRIPLRGILDLVS
jgi:maltose alpha-D-glucosyltransferase/alpha-amylase